MKGKQKNRQNKKKGEQKNLKLIHHSERTVVKSKNEKKVTNPIHDRTKCG